MRNPRSSPPELPGEDDDAWPGPRRDPTETASSAVEPIHLPPLLPRRHPWLVVEVDGTPATQGALAWALREAARREATVLAVGVVEPGAGPDVHEAVRTLLEAQTRHAADESGVAGRVTTALLAPVVLEALGAAAAGADLVVADPARTAVLRPAVPRRQTRRPVTRCA